MSLPLERQPLQRELAGQLFDSREVAVVFGSVLGDVRVAWSDLGGVRRRVEVQDYDAAAGVLVWRSEAAAAGAAYQFTLDADDPTAAWLAELGAPRSRLRLRVDPL